MATPWTIVSSLAYAGISALVGVAVLAAGGLVLMVTRVNSAEGGR